jgi:soluble lytic murein transglycosylase-like protein
MRFCFNAMRFWGLVLAACAGLGQAAPASRVTTVVRPDPVSGKLIRIVVVAPRAVPPQVVPPTEVRPVAAPATGIGTDQQTLERMVEQTAQNHELDPLLVDSVVRVESGYNPQAVSPKGAQGLMQLIPSTAHRFGVKNPFDPRENIEGGVRYLKYLKEMFKDDRLALAAYNAGEAAVARHGWIPPYPETQNYVYQVGKRYGEARRAAERKQAKQAASALAQPSPPEHPPIEQFIDSEGRLHIRTR